MTTLLLLLLSVMVSLVLRASDSQQVWKNADQSYIAVCSKGTIFMNHQMPIRWKLSCLLLIIYVEDMFLSCPSAKISLTLCTLNALLPKEVQSNYLNYGLKGLSKFWQTAERF